MNLSIMVLGFCVKASPGFHSTATESSVVFMIVQGHKHATEGKDPHVTQHRDCLYRL